MTQSISDQGLIQLLRRAVIRLSTVEAGHGFDDVQPFARMIGDARIVALGEATHGTREFFQLKHRLVEFLVAELGFTTFAIEANWPECERVNDYVTTGGGDAAAALAGLCFWTWDTEEVLSLIEWMRSWNAEHGTARQVQFAGIDAQFPSRAVAHVRSYLGEIDAAFLASVSVSLDLLSGLNLHGERHDDAIEQQLSETVRSIETRFGEYEAAYVADSSRAEWRSACHQARILGQIDATRQTTDDAARFNARDRAMADNVDHLIRDAGSDAKVIVWAHNGHVTRDSGGMFDSNLKTMGETLAERYGRAYFAVGFAFGAGSFQAMVEHDPGEWALTEVTLGAPPASSLDAALAAAAQSPASLLDMRQQQDCLAGWLSRELATRESGAVYSHQDENPAVIVPVSRYDAIAFVSQTTRARPTKTGHRPRR